MIIARKAYRNEYETVLVKTTSCELHSDPVGPATYCQTTRGPPEGLIHYTIFEAIGW